MDDSFDTNQRLHTLHEQAKLNNTAVVRRLDAIYEKMDTQWLTNAQRLDTLLQSVSELRQLIGITNDQDARRLDSIAGSLNTVCSVINGDERPDDLSLLQRQVLMLQLYLGVDADGRVTGAGRGAGTTDNSADEQEDGSRVVRALTEENIDLRRSGDELAAQNSVLRDKVAEMRALADSHRRARDEVAGRLARQEAENSELRLRMTLPGVQVSSADVVRAQTQPEWLMEAIETKQKQWGDAWEEVFRTLLEAQDNNGEQETESRAAQGRGEGRQVEKQVEFLRRYGTQSNAGDDDPYEETAIGMGLAPEPPAEPVGWGDALSVHCPICSAEVGERCENRQGRRRKRLHPERYDRARQEPRPQPYLQLTVGVVYGDKMHHINWDGNHWVVTDVDGSSHYLDADDVLKYAYEFWEEAGTDGVRTKPDVLMEYSGLVAVADLLRRRINGEDVVATEIAKQPRYLD